MQVPARLSEDAGRAALNFVAHASEHCAAAVACCAGLAACVATRGVAMFGELAPAG